MVSWMIRETLEMACGTVEEQQKALIELDRNIRYIRKTYPHKAERCTQILRDINYAVNIYIPKKRRLSKALCKDAMQCLKVHLEIETGMIGADRELQKDKRDLTEERNDLAAETKDRFKDVLNLEIEIAKTEREIGEITGEIKVCPTAKDEPRKVLKGKEKGALAELVKKLGELEDEEEKTVNAICKSYAKHHEAIRKVNAKRFATYNEKINPASNGLRANKV